MKDKDLLYIGLGVAAAYALYKWNTRNTLTPDEKEQFFGLTEASNSGASQSELNPDKLLLPTDGGVYRIDPSELNIFQRWYVSHGYYTIVNDVLKPSLWGIFK